MWSLSPLPGRFTVTALRGGNTEICFAKWDGEKFVECDKLGRVKV